MNIIIDKNTLYCIIAIVIFLVIVSIMCFIAYIYRTKRKYDSIDIYNKLVSDKLNSYKENENQLYKNMEDTGIVSKNEKNLILIIFAKIRKVFRDSK